MLATLRSTSGCVVVCAKGATLCVGVDGQGPLREHGIVADDDVLDDEDEDDFDLVRLGTKLREQTCVEQVPAAMSTICYDPTPRPLFKLRGASALRFTSVRGLQLHILAVLSSIEESRPAAGKRACAVCPGQKSSRAGDTVRLVLVVSSKRRDETRLQRIDRDISRLRRTEKKRAIALQRAEIEALRERLRSDVRVESKRQTHRVQSPKTPEKPSIPLLPSLDDVSTPPPDSSSTPMACSEDEVKTEPQQVLSPVIPSERLEESLGLDATSPTDPTSRVVFSGLSLIGSHYLGEATLTQCLADIPPHTKGGNVSIESPAHPDGAVAPAAPYSPCLSREAAAVSPTEAEPLGSLAIPDSGSEVPLGATTLASSFEPAIVSEPQTTQPAMASAIRASRVDQRHGTKATSKVPADEDMLVQAALAAYSSSLQQDAPENVHTAARRSPLDSAESNSLRESANSAIRALLVSPFAKSMTNAADAGQHRW